ncbi:lysM and putative peptidoglycan-binding domain-containing protein 4 [Osmerus eperlanus]|uniref:lysM and putative peptidoglycan-binding domain-containing protein 4 n=1 Tax=Osmerus eperlanus TaxID=29151 RepID=UPI002E0D7811
MTMRRGEPLPQAFQAPVDVHASVDGQVYMFRRRQDDSADSSDEEMNVMELRPRGRQEQDRAGCLQLVEREVSDGDNLNKLALQYGCKVADIKRANNLIQEQDLFALKLIKIPVKKHSFLTEAKTELEDPQQATPNSPTPPQLQDRPEASCSGRPHLQDYTDYLKEVDHDIEKLIQTTDAHEEVFSESTEKPPKFGFRGQRLTSYGADWGIQWWNAVVAMLLIGIILPIFYVVYFKTKNTGVTPGDGTGIDSHLSSANSSGTDTVIHRSTDSSHDSVSLGPHKPHRPM